MKLIIKESQKYTLDKYIKENGLVIVDKNTDPNTVKKYTDKDIKVAVVDDSTLPSKSSLDEFVESNGFSIDKLKDFKSLDEKINYAKENLKEIGKGSSRIVFEIDNYSVLKIALNTNGLKQNKSEYIQSNDSNPILAKCVDAEVNQGGALIPFIIMERATPVTEKQFKDITKVDFRDMMNLGDEVFSSDEFFSEITRKYKNNQFIKNLQSFVEDSSMGRGIADCLVLTSYGKIKINGKWKVVLVDYGYNEESIKDYHYS